VQAYRGFESLPLRHTPFWKSRLDNWQGVQPTISRLILSVPESNKRKRSFARFALLDQHRSFGAVLS